MNYNGIFLLIKSYWKFIKSQDHSTSHESLWSISKAVISVQNYLKCIKNWTTFIYLTSSNVDTVGIFVFSGKIQFLTLLMPDTVLLNALVYDLTTRCHYVNRYGVSNSFILTASWSSDRSWTTWTRAPHHGSINTIAGMCQFKGTNV